MPAEVTPRRFPPPWTVEKTDACFIVKDQRQVACVCLFRGRARPALRHTSAHAGRGPADHSNIAKLPELLKAAEGHHLKVRGDSRRASARSSIDIIGGQWYFPNVFEMPNIVLFRHSAGGELEHLGFA
jgi:hypothetical protein